MIKIKEAIIVEGKYDKIRLSSIIDGIIIETNGFRIFKDKSKMALLKKLADTNGLLIFTDSDSAGFLIRNHIRAIIPKEKIKHAYIPNIYGKERRKNKYSKEGKLGVEGVSEEIILNALKKAGVIYRNLDTKTKKDKPITRLDLYNCGLIGKDNSAQIRKNFIKSLDLPEYLSVNALLDVLNCIMTYEEFKKINI